MATSSSVPPLTGDERSTANREGERKTKMHVDESEAAVNQLSTQGCEGPQLQLLLCGDKRTKENVSEVERFFFPPTKFVLLKFLKCGEKIISETSVAEEIPSLTAKDGLHYCHTANSTSSSSI